MNTEIKEFIEDCSVMDDVHGEPTWVKRRAMELLHKIRETPEHKEPVTDWESKVRFYREQTEKIRNYIRENKIGRPSQNIFEAMWEFLAAASPKEPDVSGEDAIEKYLSDIVRRNGSETDISKAANILLIHKSKQ